MFPAVKLNFTQEDFRRYVSTLNWPKWRPNKTVWHNTAAPSLAQWIKSANEDRAKGLIPGISRIKSLETFFRDNQGWSGCPHLFIANDFIWVMNPLTAPGTHSPSWNSASLGFEMIGDFSKEDDDAGEGLKVKQNTIFATAILCEAIGMEPISGEVFDIARNPRLTFKTSGTIFLHKQDPATTHDCPGAHIARDKAEMIEEVASLMSGGEHDAHAVAEIIKNGAPIAPVITKPRMAIVQIDDLNFRKGPGVNNESRGHLDKGVAVEILGEANNGTTSWLQVKTPAGYIGWASAKYIEEVKV